MRSVVKNKEVGGLNSGGFVTVSDENVVKNTMMEVER